MLSHDVHGQDPEEGNNGVVVVVDGECQDAVVDLMLFDLLVGGLLLSSACRIIVIVHIPSVLTGVVSQTSECYRAARHQS